MTSTFLEDYSIHDVLETYFIANVEALGMTVEHFGTNDRHSNQRRGYGPDLQLFDANGNSIAFVEIKSKRLSSDDWYGRLDRDDWEDYLYGDDDNFFEGAKNVDEEVFLYFGVVDEDNGEVIRDGFIKVDDEDQVVEGFQCYGDIVVELDTVQSRNYNWFFNQLFE